MHLSVLYHWLTPNTQNDTKSQPLSSKLLSPQRHGPHMAPKKTNENQSCQETIAKRNKTLQQQKPKQGPQPKWEEKTHFQPPITHTQDLRTQKPCSSNPIWVSITRLKPKLILHCPLTSHNHKETALQKLTFWSAYEEVQPQMGGSSTSYG